VNLDTVVHLSTKAMLVTLEVSAPFLLAGLAVGLLVSIFQAAAWASWRNRHFVSERHVSPDGGHVIEESQMS
jgi:hypothetical protein